MASERYAPLPLRRQAPLVFLAAAHRPTVAIRRRVLDICLSGRPIHTVLAAKAGSRGALDNCRLRGIVTAACHDASSFIIAKKSLAS